MAPCHKDLYKLPGRLENAQALPWHAYLPNMSPTEHLLMAVADQKAVSSNPEHCQAAVNTQLLDYILQVAFG